MWAPFVELELIDGPHGALHVLDTHEALVQTQVVSHRVFPNRPEAEQLIRPETRAHRYGDEPCGGVSAEVAERGREPVVDFVQRQLPVGRLDNCLNSN